VGGELQGAYSSGLDALARRLKASLVSRSGQKAYQEVGPGAPRRQCQGAFYDCPRALRLSPSRPVAGEALPARSFVPMSPSVERLWWASMSAPGQWPTFPAAKRSCFLSSCPARAGASPAFQRRALASEAWPKPPAL